MKINKNILMIGLVSSAFLGTVSCTDKFMDYNKNPYGVSKDDMQMNGYSLTAAMQNLQVWNIPLDVNQCQFTDMLLGGSYGGYLSDSNPGFAGVNFGQYSPLKHWIGPLFDIIISKSFIYYNEIQKVTDNPVPIAVGQICRIAALQRVTDTYGPIPYSNVGNNGELTAPYDSQKDIYYLMFDQLDAAIQVLTDNSTNDFSSNADLVYQGSVLKWIKFANSLRLRLAVRISNVDPDKARMEGEKAVSQTFGVMENNDDNAFLKVLSANPFYVVMYEYNGGDSRVGADIINYMNGYADPRRNFMFTEAAFEGAGKNTFCGLRTGIDIPDASVAHSYSNYKVESNTPIMWMNAAEVSFLRAEGALRGWSMNGTAEEFYNNGIRLSFEQWGAKNADSYLNDAISTPEKYIDPVGINSYTGEVSDITIAWSDSDTFERNLERIITQKWIANFPLGIEAWSEYRRTGYPRLMEVAVNNSGGIVDSKRGARRVMYPENEVLNNTENYNYAVSTLLGGPDNMATDLWWAKKN